MRNFPRWEHFAHGADIGVRGYGHTLSEAYEQTAIAVTGIVTNPQHVAARNSVSVACEAPDEEFLLVDWLNGVIYEMSTRKMLFCRFEVAIDNNTALHATLWGEPLSIERHEPAVEPKGATYTALSVKRQDDLWVAQCVIDV